MSSGNCDKLVNPLQQVEIVKLVNLMKLVNFWVKRENLVQMGRIDSTSVSHTHGGHASSNLPLDVYIKYLFVNLK